MFQTIPVSQASRRVERGGIKGTILSIYYDPFKWSLVKSILFFAVGVKTANDFVGFDVLNPNPQ